MTELQRAVQDDEWIPANIILIDQSLSLVDAWKRAFERFANVAINSGDYFQLPADAIVSPANSFGIMDGGIDLAIRDQLGYGVESKIQSIILDKHHGELHIGCAEIVETGRERYPYLICAPTMRIPERVANTLNAYIAFRAILLACERHNQQQGQRSINTLLCCGLAAGVGGMAPETCAGQMLMAYKTMLFPPVIGRYESIHEFHRTLRSL
jgi:O-acetyl-ADP-ribose deacetylase (regulator of RNase III)